MDVVWGKILEHIRNGVGEKAYATWFVPLRPVSLEKERLTLEVPTAFFIEYIETNYLDVLGAALRMELGQNAKLNYQVRSDIKPVAKIPALQNCTVDGLQGSLLALYRGVVESRGGVFCRDENTKTKAEKVSKWMIDSPKRGLLLMGTVGNGKSTMLKAMARYLGPLAVSRSADEIFANYKDASSWLGIDDKHILIIDDLGTEPESFNDFGEKHFPLAELLMKRYRSNSITIIATNLTSQQIQEIYGDRVIDRMQETFAVLKYTEPSYRSARGGGE